MGLSMLVTALSPLLLAEPLQGALALIALFGTAGALTAGVFGLLRWRRGLRPLHNPTKEALEARFGQLMLLAGGELRQLDEQSWLINGFLNGLPFQLSFEGALRNTSPAEAEHGLQFHRLSIQLPALPADGGAALTAGFRQATQAYGGRVYLNGRALIWEMPLRQPGGDLPRLVMLLLFHCPTPLLN